MVGVVRLPRCSRTVTESKFSTCCCRSSKWRKFCSSRAVFASRERDGVYDAASGCSPAGGRVNFAKGKRKMPGSKGRAFVFYIDDVFSVVAIDPFPPLMPLLRFHRQSRDRACFEPTQGDRFAGLFAIAVRAIIDARQRLVDLGD